MPTGNDVVDRALEAHGGEARWKALSTLTTQWTFRGMMFKMRMREAQLKNLTASISTREPRVVIHPYPKPGMQAVFTPQHLQVSDEKGVISSREHPRSTFGGLRTVVWWDDLEMLYFAGYVLWNYPQLPFLLLQPGLTLEDAGTSKQGQETWNKVKVTFPSEMPTHSPVQTFYFGPDGLLRRHDYCVAIMSPLARGARYIHSYQDVDGFKLPQRIEMKLGMWGESYAPFPSLGYVDLDNMKLS